MGGTINQHQTTEKHTERTFNELLTHYLQKDICTTLFSFAFISVMGLIIYANSFNVPFIYDDTKIIQHNVYIRDPVAFIRNWEITRHRAVADLSFALNYKLNKNGVFGYHLINILIHITNALLVRNLVVTTLSLKKVKKRVRAHKNWLGLLAATIFLVHPLQTGAVTYIVQRYTSLATFWYLLSLSLYVKAVLKNKGKVLLFSLAFLSAILGIYTKEIVFTLPLAILIYHFYFLKSSKSQIVKIIIGMVFIIGLCVALIISRYNIGHLLTTPQISNNGEEMTSYTYLLTQFRVIVKYIQLLFLPISQNVEYYFPLSHSLFEPDTGLSFLFLVGLVVLGIWLYKKERVISFAIAWFFITLSVESSIIPIRHVIFEHRLYLPMVGFSMLFVIGTYCLLRLNIVRTFLVVSIVILIFSLLTIARNSVWHSKLSLWQDALKKSPNITFAQLGVGSALAEEGKYSEAVPYFQKAIELEPENLVIKESLGMVFMKLSQYDKAAEQFEKIIQKSDKFPQIYYHYGYALIKLGKAKEAEEMWLTSLRYNPQDTNSMNMLMIFYRNSGDKAKEEYYANEIKKIKESGLMELPSQ